MDPEVLQELLRRGAYGDTPVRALLYTVLWGFVISPPGAAEVVARASHGALARAMGRHRTNVGRDLHTLAQSGWIVPRHRNRLCGEYILATRGSDGRLRLGEGGAYTTETHCTTCHRPLADHDVQTHAAGPLTPPSNLPSSPAIIPAITVPASFVETPFVPAVSSAIILPSSLTSSGDAPTASETPLLPEGSTPAASVETLTANSTPLRDDPLLSPRAHAPAIDPPKGGLPSEGEVEKREDRRTGGADAPPVPSAGGDSLPPPEGGRTFISLPRTREGHSASGGGFSVRARSGIVGKSKSFNPLADEDGGEDPGSQTPEPDPTPPARRTPRPGVKPVGGPGALGPPLQATHPAAPPAGRPRTPSPFDDGPTPGRVRTPGPGGGAFSPSGGPPRPLQAIIPSSTDFAARIQPLWSALFAEEFPTVAMEAWGTRERRILNDFAAQYGPRDAGVMAFLFLKGWKPRWAKEWFWNKERAPTVGLLFLKHGSLAPHVQDVWDAYRLDGEVMPFFRAHFRFEDSDKAVRYSEKSRLLGDLGYADPDTGSLLSLPAAWLGKV